MGNSLTCNDERLLVEHAQCATEFVAAATCNFPFLLELPDGTVEKVSSCLSLELLAPPLHADALAGFATSAYWCSVNTSISLVAGNTSQVLVGGCSCSKPEEDSTWLLGVLFSILSSMATTVGMIMQKIAHNKNDAKPDDKKAVEWIGILLSPYWLLAFAVMVLFPLPFDFIALALAPQSLLVPFAGLSLILNQMFAPLLLGEKLDRVDIIATVIIVAGLVLTTSSGSKTDVELNACQLLERYLDSDFVAAFAVLLAIIAVCLLLIHFVKNSHVVSRIKPVLYAFCAGAFGGMGNVFFKATGELAEAGLRAEDQSGGAWTTVHPYYHILLVIFFSVLQISHINQGLRKYNAILYIPLYNCMYILASGTIGAITYKEFATYSTLQFVLFPLGLFVTLFGIMVMTRKTPDEEAGLKVLPEPSETHAKKNESAGKDSNSVVQLA